MQQTSDGEREATSPELPTKVPYQSLSSPKLKREMRQRKEKRGKKGSPGVAPPLLSLPVRLDHNKCIVPY